MFTFGNSHPSVTRGSHVSRAPPHHTAPRFSQSSWYFFRSCLGFKSFTDASQDPYALPH